MEWRVKRGSLRVEAVVFRRDFSEGWLCRSYEEGDCCPGGGSVSILDGLMRLGSSEGLDCDYFDLSSFVKTFEV